ncbi:MAG: DUF2723 domain-containing protein [bacterium]|nr:DUF2723 domain-containing protein [bacterium]
MKKRWLAKWLPRDEPINQEPFSKIDYAGGLLVLFVSFGVYLVTLTPTIGFHDSGELITVAYTLGIAHPPGYPLYTLLGKVFCTLIPIGSIAYRMNIQSSLFASLAVMLVYFITLKLITNHQSLIPKIIPAIVAPLILAFTATFWQQAVIAEKYTLNAFFFSLLIFILLKWQESITQNSKLKTQNYLYLFSFLLGLSFCHHFQTVYLVPGSIFFILAISWKYRKKLKTKSSSLYTMHSTLYTLLFFILPLTLWLYLPLRANQTLFLNCNWGDPKTWERFITHLSVKEYHYFMIFSVKECLSHLFLNLKTVFVSEYGLLILFSICGFFTSLKNKPLFSLFLLLVGLANIFHLTTYAIPVSNTKDYHLPSYIIFAFWTGQAMFFVLSFAKRFSLLLLFVPLLLFIPNYHDANKTRYYFAYDNGRNILKPLRNNSLLFTETDDDLFPLWYLQYCSRLRDDTASVNIIRLQYDWYAEELKKKTGLAFSLLPQDLSNLKGGEDIVKFRIKDIVDKNIKNYPVYIFPFQFIPDNPSFREGIAYRILKKDIGEAEFKAELARNKTRFVWREFNPDSKGKSMISRYADVYYGRGLDYGYKGMYKEAVLEFKKVLKHSPLHSEAFFNLGVAYFKMGRIKEAETYFKKTLATNPAHQSARVSLDLIYQQKQQQQKSLTRNE